jgi:hypothetical protein
MHKNHLLLCLPLTIGNIFAVIVLGVPSHENDALRGVSTAVEIVRRFSSRKVPAQIGISL